jgi:hypothetical protein
VHAFEFHALDAMLEVEPSEDAFETRTRLMPDAPDAGRA